MLLTVSEPSDESNGAGVETLYGVGHDDLLFALRNGDDVVASCVLYDPESDMWSPLLDEE